MDDVLIDVAAFDRLSAEAAAALIRPVCASGAWIDAVVAGRPYATLASTAQRSREILAGLNRAGLEQALAAHPRIGDRPAGDDRESTWSRGEQATASDDNIAAQLRAGNVEYENRFGHVFLICATGKSPEEMLVALQQRLEHDDDTEWEVVRRELIAIVDLRLGKTLQ